MKMINKSGFPRPEHILHFTEKIQMNMHRQFNIHLHNIHNVNSNNILFIKIIKDIIFFSKE